MAVLVQPLLKLARVQLVGRALPVKMVSHNAKCALKYEPCASFPKKLSARAAVPMAEPARLQKPAPVRPGGRALPVKIVSDALFAN